MTWPLNGSEAGGDLVSIQICLLLLSKSSCYNANWMLFHDKSREVCIKARSTPASLPFKGQVTDKTTVKWSIQISLVFLTKLGFSVYINLYKTLKLVSLVSLLQAEANDVRIQQANSRARDILRNC